MLIKSGLASVTFRQLSPKQIVELACQARLTGIEWGGDTHVPHGDLKTAHEVRQMTLDSGLQVASYGSYAAVVPAESVPFESILETALELGAPTLRIWAGRRSSQQADAAHWQALVDEAQRLGDLAAAAGVVLAFEYHAGTLTDTVSSARDLLTRINHPSLRSYWQLRSEASPQENRASLEAILPWLANLHIFNLAPVSGKAGWERRPLAEAQDAWQEYLSIAAHGSGERYALLEFVRADAPEAFLEDAAVLTDLCAVVTRRVR